MQTLLSAAADKKQAPKSAPYSGKFGACFTCSVRAYASCENRMDSLCPDRLSVQRGTAPLALGHPIGVSSIPVGTRFSAGKSSVLYLCFRLTSERGSQWHLHYKSAYSFRSISVGSRKGKFSSDTHKIRLSEKGSKGIYPI